MTSDAYSLARILLELLSPFGNPLYLIVGKPRDRRRMPVHERIFMQISARVRIYHIENTLYLTADSDCDGIVAVTGLFSLSEQAVFRVFELLALPVHTHRARSLVIAENGRPRNSERFQKIYESLEETSVIVEFAVNEISRNDY